MDRGRQFEQRLAKLIRQKLHLKAYRDKRSGAGEVYKSDIAVPGFLFHIEAKSQATIKLMEWWRQTTSACPIFKTPLLVIDQGAETMAVMRFDDFLNLMATMQDDAELIESLR